MVRSEQRRDLARKGEKEGAREGNLKGDVLRRALASIQCIHKPYNAALAIGNLGLERLIFFTDVHSQMNLHACVNFGPDRSSSLRQDHR